MHDPNNINEIHVCFFVFCTKFCIAKIVKRDFFGIKIMENYIAFRDRDKCISNPVI